MAPTFFSASWVEVCPLNQLNSPEVLLTTFKIIPNVVDFPLPLGPRIPYTFPFSMVKERFFTAVRYPNFLVRSLTVSIVLKMTSFFDLFVVT